MLKLYDYYRSSAAYRVRIALNLKGLQYERHAIHLLKEGGQQFSDAYKQINPLSLVPSLQDENFVVSESLAIIEYINEKYPTPPLLPENIKNRALVRAFALTIVADTHPLCNLRVNNYLASEFKITDEQKKQWIQHWIMVGLTALETQLTINKTSGNCCFGNAPTLADICLIPQLYSAKRFECDLTRFPALQRIGDYCNDLTAFSDAYPVEPVTP
jgi:maleylacetoacetate isomerase